MKDKSIIGGVLLVVGTSIGAGMLALPASIAQNGFLGAIILFMGVWIFTIVSALLLLEVNLWLPANSNIISMAKATLGRSGQVITWLSYLLLLYSLLCAYIAGGSDVLSGLFTAINLPLPHWLYELIFVGILGYIVYCGIRVVDYINRGLMSAKFLVLIILLLSTFAYIHPQYLLSAHLIPFVTPLTVVITSFGYAAIVPSLRTYYHSDTQKLRKIIIIGSLIPLTCYSLWIAAVLGMLPLKGPHSLLYILHSADPNTQLTTALVYYSQSEWIKILSRFFTSICMATSFLGVSICLSDFFADALKVKKQGRGNIVIYGLTYLPPLAIVLFYPAAFFIGLSYAGIWCVVLLTLLPAVMVWSGRYRRKIASGYQVAGGKTVLVTIMLISSFIIILGVLQDLHLLPNFI